MTLAELDQQIAQTTSRLRLLKKLRKGIEKTEEMKRDLSK